MGMHVGTCFYIYIECMYSIYGHDNELSHTFGNNNLHHIYMITNTYIYVCTYREISVHMNGVTDTVVGTKSSM